MKYLAILKDSLREARDSWVLVGLFAMSTFVILFVAQLSFKPQTAEKTMAYFFSSPFPCSPKRSLFRRRMRSQAGSGRWIR